MLPFHVALGIILLVPTFFLAVLDQPTLLPLWAILVTASVFGRVAAFEVIFISFSFTRFIHARVKAIEIVEQVIHIVAFFLRRALFAVQMVLEPSNFVLFLPLELTDVMLF